MQTFLPYKKFQESAKVLDYRRLGKQRLEAKQILEINLYKLQNPNSKIAWENHPAGLMWRGYEFSLALYVHEICFEWKYNRGYKDTLLLFFDQYINWREEPTDRPFWLGNKNFHLSHQSNLIRKDYSYYSKDFPNVPNNLEYVWPVKKDK